jgi:hypothetical protein
MGWMGNVASAIEGVRKTGDEYKKNKESKQLMRALGISEEELAKYPDLTPEEVVEVIKYKQEADNVLARKGKLSLETQELQNKIDMQGQQKEDIASGKLKIKSYGANGPIYESAVSIPKLDKGEIWNPETETVEFAPGSKAYLTQKAKYIDDTNIKNTLNTKTDLAVNKFKEILDPKNRSGFEMNFGGYNALLSKWMPWGGARDARNKIESAKSSLMGMGKELMQAGLSKGGAIGQITEREWPILQAQISNLNSTMSEEMAEAEINNILNTYKKMSENIESTYEEEWANSQFAKEKENRKNLINPNTTETVDPIQKAKEAGYTDEEIQAYLSGR